MGWGVCERALKLHPSRKGLSGKAEVKTGIGQSDFPGLQGGPRKCDLVFFYKERTPRLYPDRNRSTGTGSKPPSAAVVKSHGREHRRKKAWQRPGQVTGKKRTAREPP